MKLIYIFIRPNKLAQFLFAAIILLFLLPAVSTACACGCNVFSAGSMWMMPSSPGLRIALTYNYMDQHTDWSGWNSAAADLNGDKEIRTNFYTLGFQYMENRDWGMMIEIPVWDRYFTTIDDMGNIASIEHTSPADIRIMGIYTGLSKDMSTGILLGLKLPTGPFNLSLLDRDTQIGTGTTDLLVGGYGWDRKPGGDGTLMHSFRFRWLPGTAICPVITLISVSVCIMMILQTITKLCPVCKSQLLFAV